MLRRNGYSGGLRLTSLVLITFLAGQHLDAILMAQEATSPKLKIVILEGEGAINNIRQRTAREPIVQVQDENNRPVAGALVLFTLPENGASGTFANGSKTFMATTDAQGKVTAKGLKPNKTEGQFQISVVATFQALKATAVISQSNTAAAAAAVAAGGVSGKLIAILAIAGAAAAGGIVAATRGGGTSSSPPATVPIVTVTTGTPTVGPPNK